MIKQTLRYLMVPLLAVTLLAGSGGVARAYLSPSNPAVQNPGVTDLGVPLDLHMPPSYRTVVPPDPNYAIGPDSVPDYLTTPNWAYSPALRKFVDPLPGICNPATDPAGCDGFKNIPLAVPDITSYPGSDYYELELVEFTQQMHTDLGPTTLRGYRQVNSGTAISPNTTPAQMLCGKDEHPCDIVGKSDNTVAPPTEAKYLGPVILAGKDRPVRIKFINRLPLSGEGGELFVPVDTTIMGAGSYDVVYDPITKQPVEGSVPGMFSQNRAELHLHGGRTPWISDGTPHQWITPDGETNPYKKGVSVEDVPDMPPGQPGEQTYYWTNQQSARLMFYHDHTWGITRVNVYVGEAAGYVIHDEAEQALINGGVIPGGEFEVPLVIQDKTFVDTNPNSPNYVLKTDPTWKWGTGIEGRSDLWWPHIYMPAQNPFDITGIAPMGRWAYGPYFWPATQNEFQPIPNPYFDGSCDPFNDANLDDLFDQRDIDWNKANMLGYSTIAIPGATNDPGNGDYTPLETPYCQPMEIPSTPNPSWGAEAFMDTPVVNGMAYPVMQVKQGAYRFRILNAAHDRFFNLQLYKADTAVDPNTASAADNPDTVIDEAAITAESAALCAGSCASFSEIRMLPAVDHTGAGAPATWPADGRPGGVPDWRERGPDWIMIGSEGGFLPQPVKIPAQPIVWNADVTTFNAGNVNGGSLILGPAERADVIVDFSSYPAGTRLILYNDAPAPWPALDPHYDYFTGAPDMTEAGGAPPTPAGFGPNTRTVMLIEVTGDAGQPFSEAALFDAFNPANPANGRGVFYDSQDPIIVGQGNLNPTKDPAKYEAFAFDGTYDNGAYQQNFNAYNKVYDPVYPNNFPTSFPNWGISRINDTQISFRTVNPDKTIGGLVTVPMQPKAIQDEQGETFDMFGRMRAGLGLQLLQKPAGAVGFVVQTYSDPSTEKLIEDGIQVWKITHNGVDTHPIHFHLFDVQVLNRVGWDGFIRLPDPTELGWKDTVRISPLEDTIVALKPVTPKVPFGVPESVRPLNPATSLGSMTELTPIDPTTGNARPVPPWNGNEIVSLDWEYVWHCHILSHEENDMMRPISFAFTEAPSAAPTVLTPTVANDTVLTLNWIDPTPVNAPSTLGNPQNEIRFDIERSTDGGVNYDYRGSALANQTAFNDTVTQFTLYQYRVVAVNAADSTPSNSVQVISPGFKIEPSASAGGMISPDAIGYYQPGVSQSYTITPATDYHIQSITVDGGSVAVTDPNAANTYEFNNIQSNHTISAVFAINPTAVAPAYMYVPAASGNGTIGLGWGASSTPGVTYVVEESTAPDFSTNLQQIYSGPSRSTTLTGRLNATYYYRVKATRTGYIGSSWVNAPNGCVVNVVVSTPASMWYPANSTSNGNISLIWGASATAGVNYVVEESTTSNFSANVQQVYSGPNLSLNLIGHANGTWYFRVKATKNGLTDSAYRNGPAGGCVVNVTVVNPAYMYVPAGAPGRLVGLGWGQSSSTGVTYVVEESTAANFSANLTQVYSGPNRSVTLTKTGPGTYYYRVKATRLNANDSSWVNGPNPCNVP